MNIKDFRLNYIKALKDRIERISFDCVEHLKNKYSFEEIYQIYDGIEEVIYAIVQSDADLVNDFFSEVSSLQRLGAYLGEVAFENWVKSKESDEEYLADMLLIFAYVKIREAESHINGKLSLKNISIASFLCMEALEAYQLIDSMALLRKSKNISEKSAKGGLAKGKSNREKYVIPIEEKLKDIYANRDKFAFLFKQTGKLHYEKCTEHLQSIAQDVDDADFEGEVEFARKALKKHISRISKEIEAHKKAITHDIPECDEYQPTNFPFSVKRKNSKRSKEVRPKTTPPKGTGKGKGKVMPEDDMSPERKRAANEFLNEKDLYDE